MQQELFDCGENRNLYVICTIFNPHKFKSRIRLYWEFKKYIESQGLKLLTVEVAFRNRPFEVTTKGNEWNLQLRSPHVIWHKESAINAGFKHLSKIVPDWDFVAWIDADVEFTNPNWASDTVSALDHYDVVQLYSQTAYLDHNNEILWYTRSVFWQWIHKKGFHQTPAIPLKYLGGGHPGLAWGIRRSAYEHLGGLIDFTVSGSGDLMMANSLMGDVLIATRPGISKGFKEALLAWQHKADKHIKGNVGYVKGCCMHKFHGISEKRGYEKRWDIMTYHQYDPITDIIKDEQGLYAWAGNKIKLEQDLRFSTMLRDEDAVPSQNY